MQWRNEDAVSALLSDQRNSDQPDVGTWLLTVGVMALGMTPLGLILAGVLGALLISTTLIFVWLASMIWVFARHGSLGSAKLLPSAIMLVTWPGIILLSGIVW